jgi:predicted amidophosphoribosyltransferase
MSGPRRCEYCGSWTTRLSCEHCGAPVPYKNDKDTTVIWETSPTIRGQAVVVDRIKRCAD